jgi:hypothetical protein
MGGRRNILSWDGEVNKAKLRKFSKGKKPMAEP